MFDQFQAESGVASFGLDCPPSQELVLPRLLFVVDREVRPHYSSLHKLHDMLGKKTERGMFLIHLLSFAIRTIFSIILQPLPVTFKLYFGI